MTEKAMPESDYKGLVEEQAQGLLHVIQSVAKGDLDVNVEVPQGIGVLSDLAVGIQTMVDNLREARAEQEQAWIEEGHNRQQLEAALADMQAVQRRYMRQEWADYAAAPEPGASYLELGGQGDILDRGEALPAEGRGAWLPTMVRAVRQLATVAGSDPEEGNTLAVPLRLYGEVMGAVGFCREESRPWSDQEIAAVETVIEQVTLALESQRLFDEEQRARSMLAVRVKELDCLNDVGRKIDEVPPVPEFLQWMSERIPAAMRVPDRCRVAIELDEQIYGSAEAVALGCQMVQSLQVGGERVGRVIIAYTQDLEFLDEESAMLGDIARRVGGYVENRRLFERIEVSLRETEMLLRITQGLAQAQDLQEMFEFVLPAYLGVLGLPQGGLLINDEDGTTGTLRALVQGGRLVEAGIKIPISGNPAMEQMMATKKPVAINNALESDLDLDELAQDLGYQSLLLVPIVIRDRVIGALGADSTETLHEFTDREISLVQTVADQLAVAMENQLLLEETQAALAEVEATHRSYLRRGWQEHLRQQKILERSGFVYESSLSEKAGGQVSAVPEFWRPEMERALSTGQPGLVKEDGGARSGLAVPIALRGQTLGVLGVEAPGDDRQWTEEDVALIQSVSEQLAQTLETARLFADTQRTAERERLIGEITAKIRASTDIADILETTATQLGQALGTSRTLVRLGLEQGEPASGGALTTSKEESWLADVSR